MPRALVMFVALFVLVASLAQAGVSAPIEVKGEQKILVVAVRFAEVAPNITLEAIRQKAGRIARYMDLASYGNLRLRPEVAGWYDMPRPLSAYKISPYNYSVDKNRVRDLVADALGAARRDGHDPAAFDQVWIVVGARTQPGQGYGMVAYCANPGMLSGVRDTRIRNVQVALTGGGTYGGPVVVSVENAHVGHVAHDLLHALGGARDGRRAVPDLYDFDLQSSPPAGVPMRPDIFAIHAGPWGIMSQHFIDPNGPPPGPLAFTRLQLGWIAAAQVAEVLPGQTREIELAPLATGEGVLAVRIPLGGTAYLLLENRQPLGSDVVLPNHGLVISHINTAVEEGRGIVKVIDANPSTQDLSDAAFKIDGGELVSYVDAKAGVAVVLAQGAPANSERLRVVVTTPEHLADFSGAK